MKKVLAILTLALVLISTPASISANDDRGRYKDIINEVAEKYNLCPELLEAVIYYESGYDAKCKSGSGAIGLMQIIPKWNKERMKRLKVNDLYDPYSNILVGADILAEYSKKYEVYEALAAYNCGEYSKKFKNVRNGGTWEYSEKILARSAQLETKHGK